MEDYVIKFELNGVEPRCACGVCFLRPTYHRGRFRRYTDGHNTFPYREKLYLLKYGQPKCKVCGSEDIKFHRAIPNQYCSPKCGGKQHGFSLPETQNKIREVVMEKYGVSSVSSLPEVKAKLSIANKGRIRAPITEETRERHSAASKEMWSRPGFKVANSLAIHVGTSTVKEKLRRSEYQKERMNDPEYVEKIFALLLRGRFSKLHQRLRIELGLEQLGFISERTIGNRMVDELNEEKKIIVEINGDYIHANPKKYKADDIIRIPGESWTAQEKWARDKKKLDYLKSKGYLVFVVWESDNIENWKMAISNALVTG